MRKNTTKTASTLMQVLEVQVAFIILFLQIYNNETIEVWCLNTESAQQIRLFGVSIELQRLSNYEDNSQCNFSWLKICHQISWAFLCCFFVVVVLFFVGCCGFFLCFCFIVVGLFCCFIWCSPENCQCSSVHLPLEQDIAMHCFYR